MNSTCNLVRSSLIYGLSDPSISIRDMLMNFFHSNPDRLPQDILNRFETLIGIDFFNPLKEREWLFFTSTLLLSGLETSGAVERYELYYYVIILYFFYNLTTFSIATTTSNTTAIFLIITTIFYYYYYYYFKHYLRAKYSLLIMSFRPIYTRDLSECTFDEVNIDTSYSISSQSSAAAGNLMVPLFSNITPSSSVSISNSILSQLRNSQNSSTRQRKYE